MALHGQPGKAFQFVQIELVLVRRADAHLQLAAQVQRIEEAVHIHHGGEHRDGAEQPRSQSDEQHKGGHLRKAPFHVSLIHLTRARDKGKAEGQKSIFDHIVARSHSVVLISCPAG